MDMPVEARPALARALEHVGARGLTVGEPVTCRRMEVPPDRAASLLARLPDAMRARAEGMLARVPPEKRPRSHWLFVFHDPAARAPGEPYTATWVNVFDDGVVDFKGQVRLETVHVFVSAGRFHSPDELRAFLDPTYTEGGEMIPSAFMREVQLSGYEPGGIEALHAGQPVSLFELLAKASYAENWIQQLDSPNNDRRLADAAVCVFPPNRVGSAAGCSMEYLGALVYTRSRLA
jgi:hypothetical protein